MEVWTMQWQVAMARGLCVRPFEGRLLSLNVIVNFLLPSVWLLGKPFVPFEDKY